MYLARKVRKNIHSNFYYLKNKLDLNGFKRKSQIDSLLKKCKSKAFRTIHEALKNCLNIKLSRLSQPFITNIKIEFNKTCLNRTILSIYKEHDIIPSFEEFEQKGYIIQGKAGLFKDFLNLTFREVFLKYLDSQQYIKDYKHILEREGEGFALLFNYISKVYVTYYDKSKGNRNQKQKIGRKNSKLITFQNNNLPRESISLTKQNLNSKEFSGDVFQINKRIYTKLARKRSPQLGKEKQIKVGSFDKKTIFEIKKESRIKEAR